MPSSASGGMIALTRLPSGRPRVDHRRGLVDPAADPAGDPLDDWPAGALVDELDVGSFQPAARST